MSRAGRTLGAQQNTAPSGAVGDTGKIEIGQAEQGTSVETDMPRLEGKQLMKVVNAVIRNSILAKDLKQAETIKELEDIYRIGLQYPDKVDVDNIQKLFENPIMISRTGKGFQDIASSRDLQAQREFRQRYMEYVVRRCGLRGPQGKAAVRKGSDRVTPEFRAEFDIPLDDRDL